MGHRKHTVKTFWEKVDKTSDCWFWTCYLNRVGGYGVFNMNNKSYFAHRLSYTIHYGKIPEGKNVCHKCDNPSCVNPEHLFLGNQKENCSDSIIKGRNSRGEISGASVLTDDLVIKIRKEYIPNKIGAGRLAKKYSVAKSTIQRVLNRKTWRHIT